MRATLFVVAAVALGCRGDPSPQPPVHLVPDMDRQPRVGPQAASPFFPDGRATRPPVPGTQARGHLQEDEPLARGRVGNQYVAVAPLPVDAHTLRHGEERFNIHCAPCHDRAGSGRGPVVRKGYPPALDLSSVRARAMSDGQVYDTLVHGVRNMPARGYALTVHDRWAVVAWVRVLQRSQHATWGELSQEERDVLAAPGGQP